MDEPTEYVALLDAVKLLDLPDQRFLRLDGLRTVRTHRLGERVRFRRPWRSPEHLDAPAAFELDGKQHVQPRQSDPFHGQEGLWRLSSALPG